MEVTIKLGGADGLSMVVDAVDGDLAVFVWNPAGGNGPKGEYAARRMRLGRKTVTVYAHRMIMERLLGRKLLRSDRVDHIDFDGFNNRRSNLRLVTHAQNIQNRRGATRRSSTGIRGVQWLANKRRWRASAGHMGKFYSFGHFTQLEDAIKAVEAGRKRLGFLGA